MIVFMLVHYSSQLTSVSFYTRIGFEFRSVNLCVFTARSTSVTVIGQYPTFQFLFCRLGGEVGWGRVPQSCHSETIVYSSSKIASAGGRSGPIEKLCVKTYQSRHHNRHNNTSSIFLQVEREQEQYQMISFHWAFGHNQLKFNLIIFFWRKRRTVCDEEIRCQTKNIYIYIYHQKERKCLNDHMSGHSH